MTFEKLNELNNKVTELGKPYYALMKELRANEDKIEDALIPLLNLEPLGPYQTHDVSFDYINSKISIDLDIDYGWGDTDYEELMTISFADAKELLDKNNAEKIDKV